MLIDKHLGLIRCTVFAVEGVADHESHEIAQVDLDTVLVEPLQAFGTLHFDQIEISVLSTVAQVCIELLLDRLAFNTDIADGVVITKSQLRTAKEGNTSKPIKH